MTDPGLTLPITPSQISAELLYNINNNLIDTVKSQSVDSEGKVWVNRDKDVIKAPDLSPEGLSKVIGLTIHECLVKIFNSNNINVSGVLADD